MFHREINGVLVTLVRDNAEGSRPFLLTIKTESSLCKSRYKTYNAAVRSYDREVALLELQAQQARIQMQIQAKATRATPVRELQVESVESFLARGGRVQGLRSR